MDGSEDNPLQANDDDDMPFEGFSQDDVEVAEQVLENAGTPIVLSENEGNSDSSESSSETDYDSP